MTQYTARCNVCPYSDSGSLLQVAVPARNHERATGHRVTVWDGPTSQLTRALWTGNQTTALVAANQYSANPYKDERATAAYWALAYVGWTLTDYPSEVTDSQARQAWEQYQRALHWADLHREALIDRRVAALFE